jgi:hypothetical protein
MMTWIVCHFSTYSSIFHLYDGDQCFLVEERTQIHLWSRDYRPSASKLTNFLTHSDRYEQDSKRRGLEVKGLVVRDRCLNHSAPCAIIRPKKICVFTVTCWKKIGSVGRIYYFFLNIFFYFEIQRVWVLGVKSFVIFLYLLIVLNTLSTAIDDIIPFCSRKRQNFQDFINFQKFSNKKF